MNEVMGFGINDVKGSTKLPTYQIWISMIDRCTNSRKYPSYVDCNIDLGWKLFSTFTDWAIELYRPGLQLDKDLIYPGNKTYSESKCCFIEPWVNTLIMPHRGSKNLPPGVSKHHNMYRSKCRVRTVQTHIGTSNSVIGAYEQYASFKRDLLMKVSEEFTGNIKEGLIRHSQNVWSNFLEYREEG